MCESFVHRSYLYTSFIASAHELPHLMVTFTSVENRKFHYINHPLLIEALLSPSICLPPVYYPRMHLLPIVYLLAAVSSATASLYNSTVTYDTVRAEMKRVLTPQEQKSYRGVTKAAMTGVKYDELFGISTAEELITAELYGRKAIPSDDPENLYLFSVGHGLTARCNPEFFASIRHQDAGFVLHQTIAELHDEYITQPRKSTPEDREFVESSLNAAATGSTSWWNGLILGSQTLTRRQQGYYCKNKGQVCGNTDDCSKIKTIQRLLCECTASNTCQTDNLPVPPYEPPSCPYHNCQS
jgi:hypothetical protein